MTRRPRRSLQSRPGPRPRNRTTLRSSSGRPSSRSGAHQGPTRQIVAAPRRDGPRRAEEAYRRAVELSERVARRSQRRRRPSRDRDHRLRQGASGSPARSWRAAEGGHRRGRSGRRHRDIMSVAERSVLRSMPGRFSSGRSASSSAWATGLASCRRSSRWPTRVTGRSCTCPRRPAISRRSDA